MPEYLIIRLSPPDGNKAAWLCVDAHGQRHAEVATGTLVEAALLAAGRRVIVLVPGTEVLLTQARVPVRSAQQLRQALPYSLEDQLAQDVEDLHFAHAPPAADGTVQVAVVTRTQMSNWQRQLREAQLRPVGCFSDTQAIPPNPASLSLVHEGARIYLVPPQGTPQVFEGIAPADALTLADAEYETAQRHLLVYCTLDNAPAWQELRERIAATGREVDVHPLPRGAHGRMAASILASPGIDLLQGDYAVRRAASADWKHWRVAAGMLAAAAVVTVAAKAAEFQQLRRAVNEVEQQVADVFRETFGAMPVVDYRLQAQAELARLGAGGGGDAWFLDALSALAVALGPGHTAQLLSIAYRDGAVDLRLRLADVATLERVSQSLSTARWSTQIQGTTTIAGGIEGRLRMTRSGA